MARKPIKTISLFSGAGGLDIGFHQSGFDVVACVEIERAYSATLQANQGKGKTFQPSASIYTDDVQRWADKIAPEYANAGVRCIIGGPPCQTFSAAGRRAGGVLGTSDPRGRLFSAYCNILEIIKPEVFVFENVYGLPGANNGEPWRQIVAAFGSLGYTLEADVLDTADFGVPQHRERLIMVGSRVGNFRFPMPTHGPDSPSGSPLRSVREAIHDLQDPNEETHDDLGGMYGHLLPHIPPGLNYAFFTREMGYPEPIFAWRSKFHDFLYKVDPDSPSRTIKAQPGKFTGPFHWQNRHFNCAELKRLQTFPDDYELVGTFGKVLEQIGNSVPPELARVIATSVREQILEGVKTLTYRARPSDFKPTFRQRQRERTKHFRKVATEAIEKRFGGCDAAPAGQITRSRTEYLRYTGLFTPTLLSAKPKAFPEGTLTFRTSWQRKGPSLSLSVRRVDPIRKRRLPVKIRMTGLEDGLASIGQIEAIGELGDYKDIFFLWAAIEKVLVAHSQFLTLVDIYGHYANRGDTVKVMTDATTGDPAIRDAIRFFGSSMNCGADLPASAIRTEFGLGQNGLDELITAMRGLRYDVRTCATHPTMHGRAVLCTYPFPVLSSRAHFDRPASRGTRQLDSSLEKQHPLFA